MSLKYGSPIDLLQNELQNATIQNVSSDVSTPRTGQIWFNTTAVALKMYDGVANRVLAELTNRLDQFAAPTATVSFNGQSITNLAAPVNPNDAATKAYVDSTALGLDVKASVRVASTANVAVSTGLAAGSVIDGVTLATGDRVLLKNQTTASENGIYVAPASGAASRSADTSTSTTYINGAFTFAEQGTVNAGAAFVVNTQGTITPGTTAVTWVQFSGASTNASNLSGGSVGAIVYQSAASTTGFLNGNTANTDQVLVSHGTGSAALAPTLTNAPAISATNIPVGTFPTLNQNSSGTSANVTGTVAVANGGTGSTTAAGARTALGAVGKYAVTIGDGSTTSYAITHNLGTTDVVVSCYLTGTLQEIEVEAQRTSSTVVTLVFGTAPATNAIRVTVIG